MKVFDNCLIEIDDAPYEEHARFDRGKVVITGESPNATVTLRRPIKHGVGTGRFEQVDRLLRSTYVQTNDGLEIVGDSEFLTDIIHAPAGDRRLRVEVTPGKRCSNCG